MVIRKTAIKQYINNLNKVAKMNSQLDTLKKEEHSLQYKIYDAVKNTILLKTNIPKWKPDMTCTKLTKDFQSSTKLDKKVDRAYCKAYIEGISELVNETDPLFFCDPNKLSEEKVCDKLPEEFYKKNFELSNFIDNSYHKDIDLSSENLKKEFKKWTENIFNSMGEAEAERRIESDIDRYNDMHGIDDIRH